MKFTESAERDLLITRRVVCEGFGRRDGLLEVEAVLLDKRNFDGSRPAEVPLHNMGLRAIFGEDMVIRSVEPIIAFGGLNDCAGITAAYGQLVGLRIGKGFSATVKRIFAGRSGCTHLTELAVAVASVAIQTVMAQFSKMHHSQKLPIQYFTAKNNMTDTCYGYRSDGETVKQWWPASYTGDKTE